MKFGEYRERSNEIYREVPHNNIFSCNAPQECLFNLDLSRETNVYEQQKGIYFMTLSLTLSLILLIFICLHIVKATR